MSTRTEGFGMSGPDLDRIKAAEEKRARKAEILKKTLKQVEYEEEKEDTDNTEEETDSPEEAISPPVSHR